MKIMAAMVWLVFSPAVFAQTVVVKSGDHPEFTRLVLELPQPTDWQMGRTAEGYELRIKGENLRFDLSGVFTDIQRNRLAAIWTDPTTGGLQFGIACACHAMPFEFRPGIIVVDLLDGPPPKGSSFELALDGSGTTELLAHAILRPHTRPRTSVGGNDAPYDWLAKSNQTPLQKPMPDFATALPIAQDAHDISTMKDALLRQLSQGAAIGIVQMEQPSLAHRNAADPLPIGPRANIHLGEVPGFAVATVRQPENTMIKDGADCIDDARLDLTKWGNDQPASMQLADSRANLIGEFDRPNTEAVVNAAKLMIHLGFGAEARQLLAQMPVDNPDVALLRSMAKLVDGAPDADGPFLGMQTCDTAAALWSALAISKFTPSEKIRPEAVLRGFSALPASLRTSLGPELAAKFLVLGDLATARSINNAVQRMASDAGPEIAVMEAKIDLAAGDPSAAANQLEPLVGEAGPAAADTLIALVDAQIAAGKPVAAQTALALAALVHEQAGSDLQPALLRAQILALGSSGEFDQAFELLPQMLEAEHDLWHILANAGSDSAVLSHAVLAADTNLPDLAVADRGKIAAHLLALGLPDMALVWIGPMQTNMPSGDRILAAKASLSNGDTNGSLTWIEGLDGAEASEVRAQALLQEGKPSEAAVAWTKAGNTQAQLRAQSWAQNWSDVSQTSASPWQAAAALLTSGQSDAVAKAPGPLALGTALVADSNAARATLAALLATVPRPMPSQ